MQLMNTPKPRWPAIQADLHTHSTFSNGSMTVDEIARAAAQAGLTHLAIMDHDTTSHFQAIAQLQAYPGLTMIGGVEITAVDPATGYPSHILGYGLEYPHMVDSFCRPLRERRHENTLHQKRVLEKNGYRFSEDLIKRHNILFKEHLLADLVASGQIDSLFGDFYYKWFTSHGPCDFDFEAVSVFEAVRVIKAAGGMAVLAHPGKDRNFSLIRRLIPVGLAGVEIDHPAHNASDRMIIREFCDGTNLLLTGGSANHGSYTDDIVSIGEIRVFEPELSNLFEHLHPTVQSTRQAACP
jgi:predicted metal-dependent phosphoesterase TrpH